MLHVLTGRRRLNDLPAHAGGEAHPGAVDIGAGFLEQVEDFGVVEKIDANLGQQPVGVVLDQLQVFFAENLNVGDVAFDEGAAAVADCPEPHVVRPDPRLCVCSHGHSSRYFHHEVTFTSGFMFRSNQATSAGVIAQSCRAKTPPKASVHFTDKA